jgi:hypothetical protein
MAVLRRRTALIAYYQDGDMKRYELIFIIALGVSLGLSLDKLAQGIADAIRLLFKLATQ